MRRLLSALAAACILLGACGGGDDQRAPDVAAGDSVFVLPSFLPAGFRIASGSVEQGAAQRAFAAVVGRAGAAGRFDDVVTVLVRSAAADDTQDSADQSTPVDVNGVAARLYDNVLIGSIISWQANGLVTSVASRTGAGGVVTDVARRLSIPAQGGVDAVSLNGAPDGFTLVKSGAIDVQAGTDMVIQGPSGARIALTLSVRRSEAPVELALSLPDRLERTKVRGHEGVIGTRVTEVAPGSRLTQTTIGWYERAGQLITLYGTTTVEQMRPIAEGLRHVSEAEWRRALPPPTTQPPIPTSAP